MKAAAPVPPPIANSSSQPSRWRPGAGLGLGGLATASLAQPVGQARLRLGVAECWPLRRPTRVQCGQPGWKEAAHGGDDWAWAITDLDSPRPAPPPSQDSRVPPLPSCPPVHPWPHGSPCRSRGPATLSTTASTRAFVEGLSGARLAGRRFFPTFFISFGWTSQGPALHPVVCTHGGGWGSPVFCPSPSMRVSLSWFFWVFVIIFFASICN